MKHKPSVTTMALLRNFYTPIQITNYKLLSLSCWLIGKSALLLINDKVKVANCCVKKNMDLKSCGSKVVGYRRFFLSKSLSNNWNTIVLTRVRTKTSKNINFALVECNSFLKSPRQKKHFIIRLYIKEQWIYHKRFKVSTEIVCDAHSNDLIHDRFFRLQVIVIIQRVHLKSSYQ